jgi:hypothetical protein
MRLAAAQNPGRTDLMSIRIVPYENVHVPQVHAFNLRLGGEFHFREYVDSTEVARTAGRVIYHERFVAIEADGTIRGGYVLKHQPYRSRGKDGMIVNFTSPISEGIVSPAYGMVGVYLLRDCMRRQPRAYSLGIGDIEHPLSRLLSRAGWKVELVPFFFRVIHPQRFLKEIAFLRHNPTLHITLDVLHWTGTGYASLKPWSWAGKIACELRIRASRTRHQVVTCFGRWADVIWEAASPIYDFIGGRDRRALEILYPAHDPRFVRIVVERNGQPLGWAAVMATQMSEHKHFGDMKVGSLVDGLALPGHEGLVVDHAVRALEKCGVDLMVSNQSHAAWKRALRLAGFAQGPSNFAFACSQPLAMEIKSLESCHINRGDGDGPINL